MNAKKLLKLIKDKHVNTYYDIVFSRHFVDYVDRMEHLVCQRPYLTKDEFEALKEYFGSEK